MYLLQSAEGSGYKPSPTSVQENEPKESDKENTSTFIQTARIHCIFQLENVGRRGGLIRVGVRAEEGGVSVALL